MNLNDLNPMQRQAAETIEGPLLIIAGAGSGKTRTMTYRIAHLMQQGVPAYAIMALTFTNKAAKEMLSRVDKLTGSSAGDAWIGTFHSICVRILRRDIEKIGYQRNFVIYDDDDQMRVLKDLYKRLDIDDKQLPLRELKSIISDAKNRLLTADEWFAQTRRDFRSQKIHDLFLAYDRVLKQANALDFDDLIAKALQLLVDHPPVLQHYQRRFSHVHVDEYQDTNFAQYSLVKLLTQESQNLCVVGDDDQSIYGWRGADIRNILDFQKDYPQAKVIKLEQNYRSTANILEAANQVIANNEGRMEKALWTEIGEGDKIKFCSAGDEHEGDRPARGRPDLDGRVRAGRGDEVHAVAHDVRVHGQLLDARLHGRNPGVVVRDAAGRAGKGGRLEKPCRLLAAVLPGMVEAHAREGLRIVGVLFQHRIEQGLGLRPQPHRDEEITLNRAHLRGRDPAETVLLRGPDRRRLHLEGIESRVPYVSVQPAPEVLEVPESLGGRRLSGHAVPEPLQVLQQPGRVRALIPQKQHVGQGPRLRIEYGRPGLLPVVGGPAVYRKELVEGNPPLVPQNAQLYRARVADDGRPVGNDGVAEAFGQPLVDPDRERRVIQAHQKMHVFVVDGVIPVVLVDPVEIRDVAFVPDARGNRDGDFARVQAERDIVLPLPPDEKTAGPRLVPAVGKLRQQGPEGLPVPGGQHDGGHARIGLERREKAPYHRVEFLELVGDPARRALPGIAIDREMIAAHLRPRLPLRRRGRACEQPTGQRRQPKPGAVPPDGLGAHRQASTGWPRGPPARYCPKPCGSITIGSPVRLTLRVWIQRYFPLTRRNMWESGMPSRLSPKRQKMLTVPISSSTT